MWSVSTNRTTRAQPFTFSDLLNLQNETLAHEQLSLGPTHHLGTLLFAEVEPVITLGQRQVAWNETPPALQKLVEEGKVSVLPGERGGNETWHGPGQWICFVLAPLEKWVGDSRGVRKAVLQTLTRILPLIQSYVPEAQIEEGPRLGIWSPQGKLVSIGIKIQNGWMKSGFAVNVVPTATSFLGINPCGLDAQPDFLFRNRVVQDHWVEKFADFPSKIVEIL